MKDSKYRDWPEKLEWLTSTYNTGYLNVPECDSPFTVKLWRAVQRAVYDSSWRRTLALGLHMVNRIGELEQQVHNFEMWTHGLQDAYPETKNFKCLINYY